MELDKHEKRMISGAEKTIRDWTSIRWLWAFFNMFYTIFLYFYLPNKEYNGNEPLLVMLLLYSIHSMYHHWTIPRKSALILKLYKSKQEK